MRTASNITKIPKYYYNFKNHDVGPIKPFQLIQYIEQTNTVYAYGILDNTYSTIDEFGDLRTVEAGDIDFKELTKVSHGDADTIIAYKQILLKHRHKSMVHGLGKFGGKKA